MTLNPLDFTGPPFLVFYCVCMGLVLFVVRMRILTQERSFPSPKLNLTDPYEIAYLRGGAQEAIKIAVLSLLDRELLTADGKILQVKSDKSFDHARRPLEKAILKSFENTRAAGGILTDVEPIQQANLYRASLNKLRLMAGPETIGERGAPILVGALVLLGLAFAKIAVALSRGHSNIFFLVVLSIISIVILTVMYSKQRTHLGDRVLDDLKSLFRGLQSRAHSLKSGGESNEAAMLMAIFGIPALTAPGFPLASVLFPAPVANNAGGGGDSSFSSGSSCGGGSSCGSSCGGGCGGCGS